MFHGMWNLLGPGIELMSPALAGGFFSSVPPEKSLNSIFSPLVSAVSVLNSFCIFSVRY